MCKNLELSSNSYTISHDSHMWQHLQVLWHFDWNNWFCATPKFINVFTPNRSFVRLLEMMVVASSVEHYFNPFILMRLKIPWHNLQNCELHLTCSHRGMRITPINNDIVQFGHAQTHATTFVHVLEKVLQFEVPVKMDWNTAILSEWPQKKRWQT